jgi:dTDP-4-dehydrorhamnose 3,5-epimerase
VVIDLRKSSKTFGKWFGTTLSKKNNKMLWIPEGFAHGFLTRSNNAMVLYKTTDYYYPQYEHTLKWNDPRIDITWPLFDNEEPIISSKDNSGLSWKQVLDLI